MTRPRFYVLVGETAEDLTIQRFVPGPLGSNMTPFDLQRWTHDQIRAPGSYYGKDEKGQPLSMHDARWLQFYDVFTPEEQDDVRVEFMWGLGWVGEPACWIAVEAESEDVIRDFFRPRVYK